MLQTSRVCSQKKAKAIQPKNLPTIHFCSGFQAFKLRWFFRPLLVHDLFSPTKNRPKSKAFKWMSFFFVIGVIGVKGSNSVNFWVVVSSIFYFHTYLGKIPGLIFFRWIETTNQTCFLLSSDVPQC